MNADADLAALTPMRRDLLRAAFATGETAVAAWWRWRDAIDWDAHLDHHAFRLLPPACRNLRRMGVADPLLPRLNGVTRQAWYANQRRLRRLQPTFHALAKAGVDILILPPTAVLLNDAAAVPDRQAPLAFAVRASQAELGIRCLRRAGWRTGVRLPRWSVAGYVLGADHLPWHDRDGQPLELRWQWDTNDLLGRFPAEVWQRAGHARLANQPVLALDATDAVHDLCRQPILGSAFGRIVDLLSYVDAAKPPPDWQRFFARAAQAPIDAAWHCMFDDLRALVPALVPPAAVIAGPVSAAWLSPAPPAPTGTLRERLAIHWSAYRRAWGRDRSFAEALRQLPGYLLARWDLPALGQLPLRVWRGLRYEWRDSRRSR